MNPLSASLSRSVQLIADPAFVTDERQRVLAWNPAAERVLGFSSKELRGKTCHEFLCGTDLFGNRVCDRDCVIGRMALRGEPIGSFEMTVRIAGGEPVGVAASIVVLVEPESGRRYHLHLFRPTRRTAESGEALRQLLGWVAATAPPAATADSPSPVRPGLTARELEVLRHLAGGTRTEKIAEKLFVSVTTVRSHIRNILQKLEAHSRLEAVSRALSQRLI